MFNAMCLVVSFSSPQFSYFNCRCCCLTRGAARPSSAATTCTSSRSTTDSRSATRTSAHTCRLPSAILLLATRSPSASAARSPRCVHGSRTLCCVHLPADGPLQRAACHQVWQRAQAVQQVLIIDCAADVCSYCYGKRRIERAHLCTVARGGMTEEHTYVIRPGFQHK